MCHWLSDAVLQCQGRKKQRRLRTEGLRLVGIEGLHDVYKGMVKHQLIDLSACILFSSCTQRLLCTDILKTRASP